MGRRRRLRRRRWPGGTRSGRRLHGAHHGLLGFDRAALGLAGALLGLGDRVADLAQPALAVRLLGLEVGQPRGLFGTLLRLLGALLDLL